MGVVNNSKGTTEATYTIGPVGAQMSITAGAVDNNFDVSITGGFNWRSNGVTLLALSTNGRLVVTGGLGCNGLYVNNGIITPTQLTASTNNYAPTDGIKAHKMRISSNAAINITGLTGGADGREVILSNIGAFSITLTHDATSTAANRFYCPNNASYILRKNGSALIWYDATSQRWRVVAA